MSKTFDKIEQDFSDAGDDYVLDAAESEDSILDDVSDDDSPTGELFSRGEKNPDAFSSFSSQTTTVSDTHGDATSLKDVAHSISSYAHHRRRRLTTFTRRHRIAVGILSILFLAALSALVVAFVRTNDIPSIDAVTNDARTHVSTPTWTPGAYDADENLMLTGIEVGTRNRTMTAISSEDAQFGATGYASAQVTTRYSGSAVVAVKTSTLGYANLSNSWKPIGQEKDTSVSFEATSGVATQKVLDAHEDLLKTLDEAHTSKGTSASYFDTYGHGSFDIVDASFDREKQTCSVVMRCTRSDKLSKISVDLRIDFAFDGGNGTWALANVGIAKNPTRDYGGLIGTWTGTFEKTESSNSGGRCYAGRYTPFSLTITDPLAATTEPLKGIRLLADLRFLPQPILTRKTNLPPVEPLRFWAHIQTEPKTLGSPCALTTRTERESLRLLHITPKKIQRQLSRIPIDFPNRFSVKPIFSFSY